MVGSWWLTVGRTQRYADFMRKSLFFEYRKLTHFLNEVVQK